MEEDYGLRMEPPIPLEWSGTRIELFYVWRGHPMKYVVKKSEKSGQFYFNIVASNGQVLASSEQYKEKSSALDTIESIKKNAATAPIVKEDV
jgi:uncharacterized protein YegP (UPF0339 family)